MKVRFGWLYRQAFHLLMISLESKNLINRFEVCKDRQPDNEAKSTDPETTVEMNQNSWKINPIMKFIEMGRILFNSAN
jgi:hypothetical protein